MQVFLPYPSILKSIESLDPRRLFKQALEAGQILTTLRTGEGWPYHPATKMMAGCDEFLYFYALSSAKLSKIRDDYDADDVIRDIESFGITISAEPSPPKWFGREDIHSSHRSRLLCKGRADAVCSAFKNYFRFRKTDDWLKKNGYPTKNALRYKDVVLLETWANSLDIPIGTSYYARHGWTDDPSKEYVWPV